MYEFAYSRATSVQQASARLAPDEDARPLAGGMSLIPVLRHRLARATELIDIGDLAELRGITVSNDGVRIGAMTPHCEVATSPDVRRLIPALAALAGRIGDPLVRNRGTLGGSLANNDPAACYPCALLGLGGAVMTNRRSIAADDFILGLFQTALDRGEIIVAVEFPRPDVAAHQKIENFASRFSLVGVFVSRRGMNVRIGVTGAKSCAFRATELESILQRRFDPAAIENVLVSEKDFISDVHADAPYRRHLVTELTRRAVAACIAG